MRIHQEWDGAVVVKETAVQVVWGVLCGLTYVLLMIALFGIGAGMVFCPWLVPTFAEWQVQVLGIPMLVGGIVMFVIDAK